jgi:putative colanic acid biosynthesis UDP-glucose lipid carrier transferase
MIVNKRTIFNLRIATDLILLNCSFILSGILAQSLELFISTNSLFMLLILQNILWYITSKLTRLYDDFNNRLISTQIILILKNVSVQVLFSVMFIFFVKEFLFTRNFIAFNGISLAVAVILKQYLFRYTLRLIRKRGRNVRRLVIIGTGEVGQKFKSLLFDNPEFGYEIAGFIDGEDGTNANPDALGKITELEGILISNRIDDAVIALPLDKLELLNEVIRVCDRTAVKSYIIPDYFRFISNKFKVDLFGDFPIITVRTNPLEEAQLRFIKRAFDILFSVLISIFFLWWLLPFIAILIKLNSKGPSFFTQKRVGRHNEEFSCIKFRTMNLEATKITQSSKPVELGDKRITRIGNFLRKTNLDEIPQFITVLIGDMSIVGPRPHPLPFNQTYTEMVEEIKLRHRIKPGITGWAQIHGLRGDVLDFDENKIRTRKRVEYDIWYIENWNIWLDIQIILETVWQIIKGKNKGY